MEGMRVLIGPHAKKERLVHHLSSSGGRRVNWAINAYLRNEFMQGSAKGKDYHPPSGWATRQISIYDSDELFQPGALQQRAPTAVLPILPTKILVTTMLFLDYSDLLAVDATCSGWQAAARTERVWNALLGKYWATSTPACSLGTAETTSMCSRQAFAQQLQVEREAREAEVRQECVACRQAKCIPIIYGFPSPELVKAMGRGELELGGDYILPASPVWLCKRCNAQFRRYPWSSRSRPWRGGSTRAGFGRTTGQEEDDVGGGAGAVCCEPGAYRT